jgi:hypothetical protein
MTTRAGRASLLVVMVALVATAVAFAGTPTSLSAAGSASAKSKATAAACRKDADCVLVADDCCPCTAGGKQRAIPAKDRAAYERARSEKCAETMCTAAMSTDPSCSATKAVCKAGACTLGGPPPPTGGP